MPVTPLSRSRLPAAERRSAIMTVAGPIFAARGYAGTTLDEIAAAAGVTKPVLYRHFASKQDLYLAFLDKHEADLPTFFERLDDLPTSEGQAAVARAILEHWLDYVRENGHSWKLLFRDASGGEEIQRRRLEVSDRAREVMAGFVETVAADRIPPEQRRPTAELLVSGLAGLALWWIDHPDTPKQTITEAATRLCVEPLVGR